MALLVAAVPASAQQTVGTIEARMRALTAEAARAKREGDSLQTVLHRLETSARDIAAETKNLEQQTDAATRVVNAYDHQLRVLDEELDSASGSLVRAQDELLIKQAALRRRLVDIYKRGPLFSFEALLSAESFGELIARYKYLHTVALRDRALVHRTEQLRDTVAGKHELLLVLQSDKEVSRAQKSEEEQRLRTLEQQWQQRYDRTQRDRQTAQSAATRNAASTRRLNDEIAQFAAESRRTDTRPNVPVPVTGSMRPSDRNTLNWPVDGDIIFSFGRAQNPNNTTVRWTGMGIAATQGTPVKAVADGKVVAAAPISTYGNTVIIQHDGGFSTYGSLGRMNVGVGQIVTKGEVIGTVGVSNPELGSYLYFQMSDRDGHPVDPLEWLRDKQ